MIAGQQQRQGFSLLELMVVVAVILVVTAMATPAIISTVNDYKLNTTTSGVAGLIQKTRMLAVTDDKWDTVATGNSGGSSYAFADLWSDPITPPNNNLDPAENKLVVYLPRGISFDTAGPSTGSMGLAVAPTIAMPSFNARGLPCTPNGLACNYVPGGGAQTTYAYFLRQDRSFGGPAWAAITVNRAGRVQTWSWNGSSWK